LGKPDLSRGCKSWRRMWKKACRTKPPPVGAACRVGALVEAVGGASPVELCLGGVEDCLAATAQLLANGKDTLAAPVCDVLVVCASQASWGVCVG
jgi:hypothetical protein